jgi:hypothetical protein
VSEHHEGEEMKRSYSQHNIGKQEGDSIRVDVEDKLESAKEESVKEESVKEESPVKQESVKDEPVKESV